VHRVQGITTLSERISSSLQLQRCQQQLPLPLSLRYQYDKCCCHYNVSCSDSRPLFYIHIYTFISGKKTLTRTNSKTEHMQNFGTKSQSIKNTGLTVFVPQSHDSIHVIRIVDNKRGKIFDVHTDVRSFLHLRIKNQFKKFKFSPNTSLRSRSAVKRPQFKLNHR